MTASVGREVDAKLLSGAAPGSTQTRPHAQDSGRQNLSDLVETLSGGHEVGSKSVRHDLSRFARCRTRHVSVVLGALVSGYFEERADSRRNGTRHLPSWKVPAWPFAGVVVDRANFS
jgi:hypothetical protein